MSDPYDTAPAGTRFLMCGYDAHPKEFASGDWVRYSDYARLKAENERLRKAGDRMAAALNGEYNYELPCVEDWNAAKDGKPSE